MAPTSSTNAAPSRFSPNVTEEYPLALAARVSSRFQLESPIEVFDFAHKGNINRQTFVVRAGEPGREQEYLLQRINHDVFTRPDRVMQAMLACLGAQRAALAADRTGIGQGFEVIELMPTRRGDSHLVAEDRRGLAYWRMMVKISDCQSFKSLKELESRSAQLEIAAEAGRGLALFGDFTSSIDATDIASPLPGYRDTRGYINQLLSVLAESRDVESARAWLPTDPELRQSTERHFLVQLEPDEYRRRREDPEVKRAVELALDQQRLALEIAGALETGQVRRMAIHGDTKLDNFLFCSRTRRVKTLVDLDTIMPHTWLVDFGDMVRSLANVAGEAERAREKIAVDREIYEALVRGFLGAARAVTREEVALMVTAVEVIALELGVRFLTDYLRGDGYFRLGPLDPPDLNKVRGLSQLVLFERLRAEHAWASSVVERSLAPVRQPGGST